MKYNTKIYNLLYKPYIEVDSNLFLPIYTKSNIVKDGLGIDTGDNISDKNYLYTEYSYFYWVLKNTELPDKIGFFHYRRHLSFKEDIKDCDNKQDAITQYGWTDEIVNETVNKYDLIMPKPLNLSLYGFRDIEHQYCALHNIPCMNEAISFIYNNYPEYTVDLYYTLKSVYLYTNNMFIMKKEIFIDYMEWIMSIFEHIESKVDLTNSDIPEFGYIGERLLTCYVNHLKRTSNLKIKEMPMVFIHEEPIKFEVNNNQVLQGREI